jgi:hypothetical protein
MAVAVVSGGHVSPRHFRSQIGSSLAVSTAAAALQSFLRDSVASNGPVPFVPEQVHELERKIVSGWLAAIESDLEDNPFTAAERDAIEKEEGAAAWSAIASCPQQVYDATLLVAAATGRVLLYLQLGDGEILSVSGQGATTRPLPPENPLAATQTASLCQPDAWKHFRSSWVTDVAMPSLVLLSTEGYPHAFRSDEDFLKIGQNYLDIIREQGIGSLTKALPAILTEATQQGDGGDDITLALLKDDLVAGAPRATRVPRALMAAAARSLSASALMEKLKIRHNGPQQVPELALGLVPTPKTKGRLRNTLLFLVVAAILILVAVFRTRIFP